MKTILRRLAALTLSAALLIAPGVSASGLPDEYDQLRSDWEAAAASQDPVQVIQAAGQSWQLLSQDGLSIEDCLELESQCALASWACEVRGDIEEAQLWLERQTICVRQLADSGEDREQALQDLEARQAYLTAAQSVEIYLLEESGGETEEESGVPVSGTWYGSSAQGGQTGESAVLAEIPFLDGSSVSEWLTTLQSSSSKFRRAAEEGGVILLVWALSPESSAGVETVLSAPADNYIEEGLRALGRLDATVLLQVGTGVNGWNSCDPGRYIQAFRKIARTARLYDNIQMVFSCSDVGRRGTSFEDFYHGDDYVDWIGVSVQRTGGADDYSFADENWSSDAYQGTGVYAANPLTKMEPVVRFAQEHNKPVVAGPCSFSVGESGVQAAAEQLSRFYTYVNMLYPQVKAVFYEDVPQEESEGALSLSDVPELARAYRSAVSANGAYLDQGESAGGTWLALGDLEETINSLQLAVSALFPGIGETTVTYYLDGKAVFTSSQPPYSYELRADTLASGGHLLWVTVESGQFQYNGAAQGKIYRLYAADTGLIMGTNSTFQIGTASEWAQPLLMNAYGRGLVTPRTSSGLREPITRLQFAELAVNLVEQTTGEPIEPAESSFQDTDDEAVLKAVAAGITSGKEEGVFAPDDPITRQEICVMLNRVIEYVDLVQGTTTLEETDTQLALSYTDGEQVEPWAAESVALLTNNGILAGKDDGRLAPQDLTTVEEAIILSLALRSRF